MNCKRVVLVLVVLQLCSGVVRGDLLEDLRDNDGRFDNVMVSYDKSYVHVVRWDKWDFTRFGEDTSKMAEDFWEPRTFKFDNECWFMVGGKVSVLSIQSNPVPVAKHNYIYCGRQYHKCGDLNGEFYELHDMQLPEGDSGKEVPNYAKQLRIRRSYSALGGLYNEQMEIEFAHGIGFGKRITKVSSVEQFGKTTIISGDIELWPGVGSTFVILLDGDRLVRKATIDLRSGKWLIRREITTKGTVVQGGLKLAKSGTYRQLVSVRGAEDKTGEPIVKRDFAVRLRAVETNLTQERIGELSKFEIEPLMQVSDTIRGIRGTGPQYMMKNCLPRAE